MQRWSGANDLRHDKSGGLQVGLRDAVCCPEQIGRYPGLVVQPFLVAKRSGQLVRLVWRNGASTSSAACGAGACRQEGQEPLLYHAVSGGEDA